MLALDKGMGEAGRQPPTWMVFRKLRGSLGSSKG